MNSEQILLLINEYMPVLVSIAGIITTVLLTISKISTFIANMKEDITISELSAELNEVKAQNAKLIKRTEILIDRLTKVQGYVEEKEKEDE